MKKHMLHTLLAALAGIVMFVIMLLVLNIPARIATGNQAQLAIQMLDAMRPPMLAIEKAEAGDSLSKERATFQQAANTLRQRVSQYLALAQYNPVLLERVRKFSDVVDNWLNTEQQFLEKKQVAENAAHNPQVTQNLMQQYQAAVQQFLHALDTLALGEKPIHHDIDQGRYANYALQVMVVAVVFYLLVLIIIFQQRNKKVLLGSFQQVQEAQQSLAKREKYLALTLDSIGDGVIATDARGNVARMNPIAEQLTGWTVQDAMGKPLKHIFHIVNAFSREPVADPVEKVLQSGQIVGLANHTLLVAKDGSEYQIADSGAPICDDDDNILGVILVFRDVTEEYRLQEEIRASRDELEQRVAERTKELESFSYAVSHDLRAPLRSINGFSQVLQDDYYEQLDDDGKDYLQRIASAALHMGELIDAMLVLSQITRKNIQHKPVDLSRLAGTIIEELENCNATQNVDWVISQGLHCTGDPELIKIALENLLNNALKYSSKNDRQTRIEFGRMEKEGQPVFFVRDNGCGFDARHANRLFTPFQRLHGKEYEGTGIGLATVQRVIDRHHGHIWAESEPEQGATFYFSLPQ